MTKITINNNSNNDNKNNNNNNSFNNKNNNIFRAESIAAIGNGARPSTENLRRIFNEMNNRWCAVVTPRPPSRPLICVLFTASDVLCSDDNFFRRIFTPCYRPAFAGGVRERGVKFFFWNSERTGGIVDTCPLRSAMPRNNNYYV